MRKIAVIGSINMDLTCQAERHPNKGETISAKDLRFIPGGKGANQAVAAARLGADVTMFGCVGDDAFADRLIDNLRRNGVNTSYIRRVSNMASGIAMITVAQRDNTIVVIPGANECVTPDYLNCVQEKILEADIIVIQNEIPLETVKAAIDLANEHGKMLIYNPAPAMPIDQKMIQKVGFLTPNEHEAAMIFPGENGLENTLIAQKGRMLVTLGAKGVAALINGQVTVIPTRKAHVADTTGAGDTFNGAFAFALANDYDLEDALRFANVAASISTESYGAQNGMPTLDFVERELRKL